LPTIIIKRTPFTYRVFQTSKPRCRMREAVSRHNHAMSSPEKPSDVVRLQTGAGKPLRFGQ
jgi:hypothetical protein